MKASISKVKLFKACRRAYFFKYVEDLVPVEKAEALQIGSGYHEYLEKMYKGEPIDWIDLSKERAMAFAYRKYIFPKFKAKTVEEWLEKPVGRHMLIGRVDGFSEDGCLVEHKTCGSDITEAYEYNLLWDEQLLAYMYLTGSRKAYYTVCRKPTIKQKKSETDEEFFDRMVAWYDEDTDNKIRLLEITRTDEEVEKFAEDFERICDEIEYAECMYINTQHCDKWGRRCEYSSICLNYDPNESYIEFEKGGRQ